MTIYCTNPQCRGVLNEHAPARCPECGVPTRTPACGQDEDVVVAKLARLDSPVEPEFTPAKMALAIGQWLQFGEDMFNDGHQQGHFCGDGWAARALRATREYIENQGGERT